MADKVLRLEKELNARFGVNAAAFDAEGVRVTDFVAWGNSLCKTIKGSPASASAICAVANGHFMREARTTREPVLGECDAGFLKFCVPVFADGVFCGIVGGCGCLAVDAEVDAYVVKRAASLSEEEIIGLAAAAKRMNQEDLARAVGFLREEVGRMMSVV